MKSVIRPSSIVNFVVCVLLASAPAWAQSPDTILVNGKILTVDAQ